jgi:hypothetical protein
MFAQRSVSQARAGGIVLGLALLLWTAGCSYEERPPAHTSGTESERKIFASSDSALEAATTTYEAYFKVNDEISADGGAQPERIKPFVTADLEPLAVESYESLVANGLHTSGASKIRSTKLQQSTESSGIATVVIYACVDISEVLVLDAANRNVTDEARLNHVSFVATFVSTEKSSPNLLLAKNDPWSGDSFC